MSDKIAEKEKEIEELEIQLETSTHVKRKCLNKTRLD